MNRFLQYVTLAMILSSNAFAENILMSLSRAEMESAPFSKAINIPGSSECPVTITARLQFVKDEATPSVGKDWNFTVKFRVGTAADLNPLGADSLLLYAMYDGEVVEAVRVFEGTARDFAVLSFVGISFSQTAPASIRFSLSSYCDELVPFDSELRPRLKFDQTSGEVVLIDAAGQELAQGVTGALDYDFEWVFVDAESRLDPNDAFRLRDAVRVTTSKTRYPVNLNYPAGVLCYRARSTTRHAIEPDQQVSSKLNGAWSDPPLIVPILRVDAHEANKNWHQEVWYSEYGRQKRVMSYYDGTLRNRQTLTSANSQDAVLIGETKYDYEGRIALNVVPAPRSGNSLRYAPRFNAALPNGNAIDRLPYFEKSSYADGELRPLNDSTGAARYFSPKNDIVGAHRDYIPSSDGFPYAMQEYTRDNTGRLRRQSGIGRHLLFETDHDLFYLYGDAGATTMRRLFGSNAGLSVNYRRHLLLDANRQAHVTYVDDRNRTVATALAGDAPGGLMSVAPARVPLTEVLETGTLDVENEMVASTNTLSIDATTKYRFTYEFTGVDFAAVFEDASFPPLCSSCKYELAIKIIDPRGKPTKLYLNCGTIDDNLSTLDSVDSIQVVLENQSRPSCEALSEGTLAFSPSNLPIEFCATLVGPGEYRVMKSLRLVEGWIDEEFEKHVRTPGYFDPTGYRSESGNGPDPCSESCLSSCKDAILAANNRADESGAPRPYPDQTSIGRAVDDCEANCKNMFDAIAERNAHAECERLREELADDLAPGGRLFDPNDPNLPITRHPEYCFLEMCERMAPSRIYDAQMAHVGTWLEALEFGYLNPLGMTLSEAATIPSGGNAIAELDPYFQTGPGLSDLQYMKDRLSHFRQLENTETYGDLSGQMVSLWQFVELQVLVQNIPSDDRDATKWQLFRGIYKGIKESIHDTRVMPAYMNDRGCTYQPAGVANVPEPQVIADAVPVSELLSQMEDNVDSYCSQICDLRTEMWYNELERLCKIPDASTKTLVLNLLQEYCESSCGPDNPLALLTLEALEQDNPLLKALADALPGCPIKDIAENDPYTYEEICREACCYFPIDDKCASALIDLLYQLIPAQSGERADIISLLETNEFSAYCLKYAESVAVETSSLAILDNDGRVMCHVLFYLSNGTIVPIERIDLLGPVRTHDNFPATISPAPTLHFTHLAFIAQVDNKETEMFVFTDCGIVKALFPSPVCVPIAPNDLPEYSSDAPGPESTKEYPLNVAGAIISTMGRASWRYSADSGITVPAPRNSAQVALPNGRSNRPWSTIDILTLGLARLFDAESRRWQEIKLLASVDTSQGLVNGIQAELVRPRFDRTISHDCDPCASEALGLLEQFGSTRPGVETKVADLKCYGSVFVDKYRARFAQVWPGRGDTCSLALYDESGVPIVLWQISGVGRSEYTAQPTTLVTVDDPPLTYSGISCWVTLGDSKDSLRVYVFSTCDFVRSSDCFDSLLCGPLQRPDSCLREVVRNLRGRLANGLDGWTEISATECFDRFRVKKYEATFIASDREELLGAKPFDCTHTLVTANGQRIDYNRIRHIYDTIIIVSVKPTTLPENVGNGLVFTGFALRIKLSWPELLHPITAYIYSECGYGLEDACDRYVTGIDTPDFPTMDDPVDECEEQQDELDSLEGNIALEYHRGEYESQVVETLLSKCFDPPWAERFVCQKSSDEYHFVLFHYDQSEQLVQTIPPEGVDVLSVMDVGHREPAHRMKSTYHYNTLNQVIAEDNPDGGQTRYWYNSIGQLRLSQNAEQASKGNFSYCKYDNVNRVIETGVVSRLTNVDTRQIDHPDFPGATSHTLSERTHNYFDELPSLAVRSELNARNLRGRVAAAVANLGEGDEVTTCFSYDVNGNVETMFQILPGLEPKRIDFEFDVLSGKVTAIHYQSGNSDQMHHKYAYDDDNKLLSVRTSRDGVIWHRDAEYTYYRHGPLAFLSLGDDFVQSLDYFYTIQGWLKGINSDALIAGRDPGRDGDPKSSVAVHRQHARDALGVSLSYFQDDYTPIGQLTGSINQPIIATDNSDLPTHSPDLFDGNITRMVTAIDTFVVRGDGVLGAAFRYDQLYRIRQMTAFMNVDRVAWTRGSAADSLDYLSRFDYDANGNLRHLLRHGHRDADANPAQMLGMDSLDYHYAMDSQRHLVNNRLLHVSDAVAPSAYDDIDDQGPFDVNSPNYSYDLDGNLLRDRFESIDSISWTGFGKVKEIKKGDGKGSDIEFVYDALQNRVIEITKPHGSTQSAWNYSYLIRGPTQEILARYEKGKTAAGLTTEAEYTVLSELTLLGKERLGLWLVHDTLRIGNSPVARDVSNVKRLGDKRFELTDQLGTVLATIVDRKSGVDSTGDGKIDFYRPLTASAADYYPFGMRMPDRIVDDEEYAFGFHGMLRDDGIKGSGNTYYTLARLYDPRVGRWWSPDPVDESARSRYSGFGNRPLFLTDPGGSTNSNVFSRLQRFADGYLDKENLKQFAKDLGQGFIDMGQGVLASVKSDLNNARDSYENGDLLEATGWALQINGPLQSLAENTTKWENAGASKSEIVSLAIGDISGMNQFMEGVTGESIDGVPLSLAEKWVNRVVGFTRVLGTAAAVTQIIAPKPSIQGGGQVAGEPLVGPRGGTSWTTARKQYWKQEAQNNPGRFTSENLERTQGGLAEQRLNKKTGKVESKELHHRIPQRTGGTHTRQNLQELWPEEHQAVDEFRHVER